MIDQRHALIGHLDIEHLIEHGEVRWSLIHVDLEAGRQGIAAVQAAQAYHATPKFKLATQTAAGDSDDVKAKVAELVEAGHADAMRAAWPFRLDGTPVPTFKAGGHQPGDLDLIAAAVEKVRRQVEAPFDVVTEPNPQPRVDTDPQPVVEGPDEGGTLPDADVKALRAQFQRLPPKRLEIVTDIARDANAAGRSISVATTPTKRRGAIAAALIAWATSEASYDDLWAAVSLTATGDQTADADQRLGAVLSRFTISQAESLRDTFRQSAAA